MASYTEGIVFDAHGAAFVSVQNNETVVVIRGSAPPAAWYRTNTPNGHKVLHDGTHLLAARGGVHHVDAEGTLIEVLAPQLATPNDLSLDGDGGVYITAPAESDADREASRSGVYYLDSSRAVHQVASGFCYPNGIVVRPDGKTLLVNDSCNRQIHEFQITSPGVITARRLFAELPDPRSVPDGMTLDQAGLLYMADYGRGMIVVFDQSGKIIREIATGLEHASNAAFGGDALTDLYVTGSLAGEEKLGQLVVLPLNVRGRNPLTLPASIRER
jgi:gluconolactonase